MAKFKMGVLVDQAKVDTARLGTAANAGGNYADTEKGKFMKFVGDSQFSLCAAGDPIGGVMVAREPATQDGWTIGSIQRDGRVVCLCDGSQAAGTGSIAVGDYVVCGTIDAKGTALTTLPKVRKATNQISAALDVGATVNQTTVNAALALVTDSLLKCVRGWKVVSVGVDGAVGDTCVIEKQ